MSQLGIDLSALENLEDRDDKRTLLISMIQASDAEEGLKGDTIRRARRLRSAEQVTALAEEVAQI